VELIDVDRIENIHLYPYFYLKEYVSFIKDSENKDVLFFADEYGNSIACKVWFSKLLKLIQPTYPPLTKNGIRLSEAQEYTFLNKWVAFILKEKIADRITQPENFAIFSSPPLHSISSSFGTYFINLEKFTEDELFDNLHTKHRNVIKNAKKNNVIIKYGKESIDDFYLMYNQTMKRSGMACQDISYFEDFYDYVPKNIVCGVAYYNDIPQGGLFMPYTPFSSFYLYGASADKIEVTGAINYLHWETIKFLKQKGVKRYDFVGARLSDVTGTKLEGIQQFKKRFGAELEKGFLWKKDLNKSKCNLYDALLRLKIKIRGKEQLLDIIDQENKKLYGL
jgi:hypothetical protein